MGWLRVRLALLALAAGLLLAPLPAIAAAPRAAGGVRLLDAMDQAPATLVAKVSEPSRLGPHAYKATLIVETPLRGKLETGTRVTVAWEELAASRDTRFKHGERILVSLTALPGASIWQQRFPDGRERAGVLAVAMEGNAFLRQPRLGSLNTLQHYLALGAEARQAEPGAGYLVDLVAAAELPLARSALQRLGSFPALDELLGQASAERLVAAFRRDEADSAFRAGLAQLIGGRSLESARPGLEALLAAQPSPPVEALEALVLLDGGASGAGLAERLEQAPPEERLVLARHARGAGAEDTLARLLVADPAPEVRAAAAGRLAELGGQSALEPLLRGLADPEPSVRGASARWLAGLGEPAVPRLLQVVEGNDPEAASAAVVALGLSPAPEARTALAEISAAHPDESLRRLAQIALGRSLGDAH